jgi:hypothetical protein
MVRIIYSSLKYQTLLSLGEGLGVRSKGKAIH